VPPRVGWPELPAGTELTIVKLAPDGSETTRYPGWILDAETPSGWIAARAEWVRRLVELDGLRFVPGDRLHEFFSLTEPFNLFSVFAPDGALRGWYANVTRPTTFSVEGGHTTVYWHDLYVDVIALPSGEVAVRDEDELEAAGLAGTDPALHELILATRDRLLALYAERAFPFHEHGIGSEH
jgi:hypothetical protein